MGFSGLKIYPSHGRTLVKADGKTFKFLSGKTQKGHDLKRNPRKITWTVLYRRRNKKPEVRKAQREQAIRAAKESKKASAKPAAAKKAVPAKVQKTQQKAQKQPKSAAPRVGGKR